MGRRPVRYLLYGLVLLASLAGALPASAAGSRWEGMTEPAFDHFGPAAGMVHDFVTALAQDREGFIWVGTQAGLDRYDGYRFVAFKHDAADPASLPGNYVTVLHVDPAGRLWVGTDSAGLARYDAETGRFVRYPTGAAVSAITEDGQGGLWIGTREGLDHLDPATGTIRVLRHDPADPRSLPDDRIWSILRDRAGRLWVGTSTGLARQEGPEGAFRTMAGAGPAAALADSIGVLAEDSRGRIWFGSYSAGAGVIDPETGAVERAAEPADGASLASQQVEAILEIAPGRIWIASDGLGLTPIEGAAGLRRLRHNGLAPDSLANDHVTALLRDRTGLVWIGTQHGLDRNDPGPAPAVTVYGGTGRPEAPSDTEIAAVAVADDGLVWLGLPDHGIDIVDPQRGRVASLRPGAEGKGLPGHGIGALAPDTGGAMWIGSDLGLYHAGHAGAGLAHILLPGDDPNPGISTLVSAAGALWIGTDRALLRYMPGTGAVTTYRPGPEGLSDGRVQAIQPMPDGTLWIGTARGLNHLDPASGRIERFLPDPADPASLGAADIGSLALDRRGRLWIGLYGGGIDLLEGRGPDGRLRCRPIGRREGLPDDVVDALITDPAGRMWVSTDNRLAVIDPDTLAVQQVRAAEGVRIRAYWAQAAAATPDGELLFGGAGGLTVIRPDAAAAPAAAASIVLTEAHIGSRPIPTGAVNRGDPGAALELAPGERSFDVEFAALDYSAAKRLRYAYRLDGFDTGWVDAPRRAAFYTNLPPGTYALHLRATGRDGQWHELERPLPVRVAAAWHQTWWFRLAVALAGLGVIYGLIRVRTAYLTYRRRELERLVERQTRELRAANERLARLAAEDGLTGLLNRRRWLELAELEGARLARTGRSSTVLLADIDHFKSINDGHGHLAGDEVLRAVAARLVAGCRSIDVLARYGGEEFVILLPETTAEDAVAAAERLREAVAAPPVAHGERLIAVTISIGLAEWRNGALDRVIARADKALYTAKRLGRNRVELDVPALP